jgi:hypothetical protein
MENLGNLIISSHEDYIEVQNEIRRQLNIKDEPLLYKYKVTLTAKSKSNGVFYDTLGDAIMAEVKSKSPRHIYRLMPTINGFYWKRVY